MQIKPTELSSVLEEDLYFAVKGGSNMYVCGLKSRYISKSYLVQVIPLQSELAGCSLHTFVLFLTTR